MAISIKPRVTNVRDALFQKAKINPLFDTSYYKNLDSISATNYAGLVSSTNDKDLNKIDRRKYDMLEGSDKMAYLANTYFTEDSREKANNELYFDSKYKELQNKQNFDNLNGFSKFLNTTGGVFANMLIEGTIGIVKDLNNVLISINPFSNEEDKKRQIESGFFARGYATTRAELDNWIAETTWLDKNGVAKVINDVGIGLAKLAPMFIPGIGQAGYGIYIASGFGGGIEQAIRGNPNIAYGNALLYGMANSAINIIADRLFCTAVFGKGLINQAKWATGPLSYMALSMSGEFLADASAQIASSIMFRQIVDKEAPVASFKECMYAGMIGALVVGITTGVGIGKTKKHTINLADGDTYTLTRYQSYLANIELGSVGKKYVKNINTDPMIQLQVEYGNLSLEEIKAQHPREYEQAYNKAEAQAEAIVKAGVGLSNILADIGQDAFNLCSKLAMDSMQYQAARMGNFVTAITSQSVNATTDVELDAAKRYAKENPGATIKFVQALTNEQVLLQKGVAEVLGKNIKFVEFGSVDGTPRNDGLAISQDTIFVEANMFKDSSFQNIITNKVILEEIVHTMQMQKTVVSPQNISFLQKVMVEQFGEQYLNTFKKALPKEYTEGLTKAEKAKLAKVLKEGATGKVGFGTVESLVAEHQAKAMIQMLLFDNFTIQRVFNTNKELFNTTYKVLDTEAKKIDRSTEVGKLTYQKLHQTLNNYLTQAGVNALNMENAKILESKLNLTPDKQKKLESAVKPSSLYEHFAFVKMNATIDTQLMIQAHMEIENAMGLSPIQVELPVTGMSDIKNAYSRLYDNIFNNLAYKQDFVQQIQEKYKVPSQSRFENPFKYQLNSYMLDKYNVIFNEAQGRFIKQVPLNNYSLDNVINYVTKDAIDTQMFRLSKFIDLKGINKNINDVLVKLVNNPNVMAAEGFYNSASNTIQIDFDFSLYYEQYEYDNSSSTQVKEYFTNDLQRVLYHETSHYFADISNLQNGANATTIKALLSTLPTNKLNMLYRQLFHSTDVFKATTAVSSATRMLDSAAYYIYQMVDGEVNADLTRKGLGSFGNSSGFTLNYTNIGMNLVGRGIFDFINVSNGYSKDSTFESEGALFPLKTEKSQLLQSKTKLDNKNIVTALPEDKYKDFKDAVNKLDAQIIDTGWRTIAQKQRDSNIYKQHQNMKANIPEMNIWFEHQYDPTFDTKSELAAKQKMLNAITPELKTQMLQLAHKQLVPNISYDTFLQMDIPFARLQRSSNIYATPFVSAYLGIDFNNVLTNIAKYDIVPRDTYYLFVGTVKPAELQGYFATIEHEALLSTSQLENYQSIIPVKIENNKLVTKTGQILQSKTQPFRNTFMQDVVTKLNIKSPKQAVQYGFSTELVNLMVMQNPGKGEGLTRVNLEQLLSDNQVGNKTATDYVMKYLFPKSSFESFDQVLYYKDVILPQLELLKYSSVDIDTKKVFDLGELAMLFSDNPLALQEAYKKVEKLINSGRYTDIGEQLSKPQNSAKALLRILQYDSQISIEAFDYLYQQSIVNPDKGRYGFQPESFAEALEINVQGKEGIETLIKSDIKSSEQMLSAEEEHLRREAIKAGEIVEGPKKQLTLQERVDALIEKHKTMSDAELQTEKQRLIDNKVNTVKLFGEEGYKQLLATFEKKSTKNLKDSIYHMRKGLEKFAEQNAQLKQLQDLSLRGMSAERTQQVYDIYSKLYNELVTKPRVETKEVKTKAKVEAKEAAKKLKAEKIEITKKTRLEKGLQEKKPKQITKTELGQKISRAGERVITDKATRKIYRDITNYEAPLVVESQVKGIKTERIQNDVNSLAQFIEANEIHLTKINDSNVNEILNAMFNPKAAYTDFQRMNNYFTLTWLFNHTTLFNAENVAYIEKLTQEQAHMAGAKLQALRQAYYKARPLNSFIEQWETEFGSKPPIDQSLVNRYNIALLGKDYNTMLDIEQQVLEISSKALPDESINFLKGTKEQKIKALKTLAKKFNGFRYMAMLSNPSTHLRNIFSNRAMRGLDRITQTFEGQIQKLFKFKEGQLKYRAGEKASAEVKAYVQTNLVDSGLVEYLSRGSKYDVLSEEVLYTRMKGRNIFNTEWLNKINNFISKSLAGEDAKSVRPKIIEYAEQLIQANFPNVETIKPKQLEMIIENASSRALTVYFKNQNLFSKTWYKIAKLNPVLDVMMSGILPFAKVTSNILSRIYQYSPFNFVNALYYQLKGSKGKNIDQFYTANIVHKYTQATIGTSLWALGAVVAATGLVHFDREDEYGGMVFQIGDFKIKLSDIAPALSPILLGAALLDTQESGNAFTRAMKLLNDQTVLGTIDNVVKYNSTAVDVLKYPFETYIKQFVPAIARSIAKVIDPNEKRTEGKLINQILSGIPGASFLVPDKVDPYTGGKVARYDIPVLIDIVNAVSPMKVSLKTKTSNQIELSAVGEELSTPSQTITINEEKIKLKPKDYKSYQQKRAQVLNLELQKLFSNPKYAKMSETDKKKEIDRLKSKATEIAKINYWINSGKTYNYSNYKVFRNDILYFDNPKGITYLSYKKVGFK